MLDRDWFDSNHVNVNSFCGKTSGLTILDRALQGSLKKVDTWDYQVNAVAASRLQYTIHPAISLIRNIGFGSDATHTFGNLDPDYFYDGNGYTRSQWILSLRQFFDAPDVLPPFLREVSDLAYKAPSPLSRSANFFKNLLKLFFKLVKL